MENIGKPALSWGANNLLSSINTTDSVLSKTYDVPTGLRHFMPIHMGFGAPWASYMLGFKKSHYGILITYTTDPDKPMWQSEVGYSNMYDFFFSVGGPIDRVKYDFESGVGEDKEYYIVWCWKGDYWNLGTGAEIGIYSTKHAEFAANSYYEIDTNLNVRVHMNIKYRTFFGQVAITLNDFDQTNWWICSFTPAVQFPNVEWIDVEIKVTFADKRKSVAFTDTYVDENGTTNSVDHYDLMRDFYEKYENVNDGILQMEPTQNKVKTGIHSDCFCGKHPSQCICTCSTCGRPCKRYSDCGYEFKITY